MLTRLLLALSFGLVSPVMAADAPKAIAVVDAASDNFVRPAYFDLRVETTRLFEQAEALCANPSEAALEEARSQFESAVGAWSRSEIIRFGPIAERNRLEKMLYWPDRKSIGLKQVQEALATQDQTVSSLGTLVQKSVALQGFGALEFLLFGTGSDALQAGDAHRCGFAKAVASNLRSRASEVEADWLASFAALWTRPDEKNPRYRNPDESLTEVLNMLIHGLELVRDVRINGFMGQEAKDDRPKQAIWWRSQQTVEALRDNLAALRRLFDEAGLANLLPEDSKWIAQSVDFEFANADRALTKLTGPIDAILQDGGKRDRLAYARLVTSSLTELIGTRLTGEIGLTAGFSSLDGD